MGSVLVGAHLKFLDRDGHGKRLRENMTRIICMHKYVCYSCTHPAPPCRAVAGSVLRQSPLQLGAPHQAAQQDGMHRKEACSHGSGLGLLHRSQQRKCGVLEEKILCCKYLHT